MGNGANTNLAANDDAFASQLQEVADLVTVALDQLIPPATGPEKELMRAMRYAALANGKRLRPFFLMESAALFGKSYEDSLQAACAVECIHTYSLIHDDLPCMDDDDFRRGQPTTHKRFGEATALLAGDALQALAYDILADASTHPDPMTRVKLIGALARASGVAGMVGGQQIDVRPYEKPNDVATIARMQRMKTGALISFCMESGAILGGANADQFAALSRFAHDIGLAFQITDDLLDAEGDPSKAGKAVGKDEAAGKTSFVTYFGVDNSKERVRLLATQAKDHLAIFGDRAKLLTLSVDYLLSRQH